MIEKTKLVLSGGGIKGICHVGALYALDKLDLLNNILEFAGTSVGSLIIALYVVGYKPIEMYEFIKAFNFDELKNMDINNIYLFGLDTGTKLEYVIRRLITNKGFNDNITLQELYDITKKKIIFTTVCVNNMKVCYLSHDNYPSLGVVKAILMSLSIPLIFCPIIYENDMYVDGGCLDNFPMNVFKNNMNETIGILITDSKVRIEINDFETYMFRVLKCVANGLTGGIHNNYEKYTVEINIDFINSIDFDIDEAIKDKLFLVGFDTVISNLEKLI